VQERAFLAAECIYGSSLSPAAFTMPNITAMTAYVCATAIPFGTLSSLLETDGAWLISKPPDRAEAWLA